LPPVTASTERREADPGTGPDRASPALVAITAVAVVVGLAVRLGSRSELWLDEALSVNIASLAPGDLVDALARDGHPPLYYFLLHGWIEVFGDGTAAVRALSAVFGVACLPLVWIAGRRLGGRDTAAAALVVVATSPFAVRYATEARMYSLVMLLVLAGWLAVRAALERPDAWRLLAVALLAGALALTHYWSFYLLAATGFGLLLAWRRGRAPAGRVLAALVAGGVLFLPWLPTFLDQAAHTGTPWGRPERPTTVFATSLTDWGGGIYGEAQTLAFLLFLALVLALVAVPLDAWRFQADVRTVPGARVEAALVVATIAIAVVAGYATESAFASRYTAVIFPLAALIAGYGLARVPPRGWLVGLAVVGLLGVVGSVRNVVTDRTQAGQLASYVVDNGRAGDVVGFCPDQLGPAVSRLLPGDRQAITFPAAGDPRFVDWADYAEKQAAGDPVAYADELLGRAGDGTVWLVRQSGYKKLGDKCDQIAAALNQRRPGRTVVPSGDEFEHASLDQYGPGRG
jgi:hypothetical protein